MEDHRRPCVFSTTKNNIRDDDDASAAIEHMHIEDDDLDDAITPNTRCKALLCFDHRQKRTHDAVVPPIVGKSAGAGNNPNDVLETDLNAPLSAREDFVTTREMKTRNG